MKRAARIKPKKSLDITFVLWYIKVYENNSRLQMWLLNWWSDRRPDWDGVRISRISQIS